MGRGGGIGFLVVAAILAGLVGPCLCGPASVYESAASHACCETGVGMKPASDCCTGCALSLRAQDPGLVRAGADHGALAPAPHLDAPVLRPRVTALSPRPRAALVPSPPPVLRV